MTHRVEELFSDGSLFFLAVVWMAASVWSHSCCSWRNSHRCLPQQTLTAQYTDDCHEISDLSQLQQINNAMNQLKLESKDPTGAKRRKTHISQVMIGCF